MSEVELEADAADEPIQIVYEESHFLFVNKPAALFSQAAAKVDSLEQRLTRQLKARDCHVGKPFVGLPHRLDRGTSGIMLVARNQRALKRFNEQFQSRKVSKFYLAVVQGEFPSGSQAWSDYLRKIPDQPKAEIVSRIDGRGSEGARQALATATLLEYKAGLSLLLVQLETGRMHQIRIQAASRGFPVVGDAAYGASLPFTAPAVDVHDHPPIALHAYSLEIRHPQTAVPLKGIAPVPEYWAQLPASIAARAKNPELAL